MKIGNTIYFDHQATTPVDPIVLQKMLPYFSEIFGNPHSSEHSLGWDAARAVENAMSEVANLICADSDEIIFTSGATESNNLAILGTARNHLNNKRKKILISSIEHKCIFELGGVLRDSYGYELEIIPVDCRGVIDVDQLEKQIDEGVFLISIMAVNNEIGSIQPLAEIGHIAKKYGAYFHCDAAQAPCALDIDVTSMNIDMLSLSGHKVYGPKGVGSLYVRRDLQGKIEPIIYGGGQQNHIRSGTVPVPLCVGFGAACMIYNRNEHLVERGLLAQKRDKFITNVLSTINKVYINGPTLDKRHPGNANLRFEGHSAQDILLAMQPLLAASSGSACTSGITEPSYVLRAIGLSDEEAKSSIRFSLGRFTTEEDIDFAVNILKDALLRL